MTRLLRIVFVAAATTGAIGTVCLAWLPIGTAVSHYVVEDMGYYLTVARNTVGGRHATLDGLNPTNGFHPLWLLVLCGVESVFGANRTAVFHVALTLCALFSLATGLLLCRQVGRHGAAWIVAPLSALLFFNYRLVSIALGGLETSLAGLTVVIVAVLASLWCDALTFKRAVVLGGMLGIACLARMDALLLAAIVLGWLTVRSMRRGAVDDLPLIAAAGAACFVVLVPWFVFSWNAVQHWLPRSGEAIQEWAPSLWSAPWSAARLARAWRVTIVGPAGTIANILGVWPLVNGPGLARTTGLIAALGALGVFGLLVWRVRDRAVVQRLAWVPIYALGMAAYYLQFDADIVRYLYPPTLVLLYFLAVVVGAAVERSRTPKVWQERAHLVAAAMLVFVASSGLQAYRRGYAATYTHRMQGAFYEDLAPWLFTHTPAGARVGAFNGGLLSYFSGRTTVNLDGVMNDNAIAALTSGTLCTYVAAQQIDYLADNERAIAFFFDAAASCAGWRARWETVHQVVWPRSDDPAAFTYVVLKRR